MVHCPHVQELRSDYQGLSDVHIWPREALYYRKSIYSGVRMQLMSKAPHGFVLSKVQGHADASAFAEWSEDWLNAVGNGGADHAAKQGAVLQSALHGRTRYLQSAPCHPGALIEVCLHGLGMLAQ